MPFGMVQLSPDTYNEGWDYCSAYHYSDTSLMGFDLYIQSVTFNGKPYSKVWFKHADIANGGTFVFTMGGQPNRELVPAKKQRHRR
jgi:putative alpha-1,2-mannosidase